MSAVLLAVVMLMVGVFGLAVVLNRDPLPQAMVFGLFGISLFLLFLVLQAPDVSLSAMVVGGVAYPLMTAGCGESLGHCFGRESRPSRRANARCRSNRGQRRCRLLGAQDNLPYSLFVRPWGLIAARLSHFTTAP